MKSLTCENVPEKTVIQDGICKYLDLLQTAETARAEVLGQARVQLRVRPAAPLLDVPALRAVLRPPLRGPHRRALTYNCSFSGKYS